jgi:hypothetical protein
MRGPVHHIVRFVTLCEQAKDRFLRSRLARLTRLGNGASWSLERLIARLLASQPDTLTSMNQTRAQFALRPTIRVLSVSAQDSNGALARTICSILAGFSSSMEPAPWA